MGKHEGIDGRHTSLYSEEVKGRMSLFIPLSKNLCGNWQLALQPLRRFTFPLKERQVNNRARYWLYTLQLPPQAVLLNPCPCVCVYPIYRCPSASESARYLLKPACLWWARGAGRRYRAPPIKNTFHIRGIDREGAEDRRPRRRIHPEAETRESRFSQRWGIMRGTVCICARCSDRGGIKSRRIPRSELI